MRTYILSITVAGFLSASSLLAGPFGLEMGMRPEKLSGLKPTDIKGRYQTTTPPSPHPSFKTYLLIFSETSGLYGVLAMSDAIDSNDFGEQVQSAFSPVEKALTGKYGKPDKYDFLLSGSIWNEPRDWMTGLTKEERIFVCEWKLKKIKLPDNLDFIQLQAVGLSSSKGCIRLSYWFTNSDAAEAENQKAQDKSL